MRTVQALRAEFAQKTIETRIFSLMKTLYLSPPDGRAGQLFVSLNSAFKPAAEYEGMLGSVILESFLGDVFTQAANDNAVISNLNDFAAVCQPDMAAEALSSYLQDHERAVRHGRGSFARIIDNKNRRAFDTMDNASSAFTARRLRRDIEKSLADLSRSLDAMRCTDPELVYPVPGA